MEKSRSLFSNIIEIIKKLSERQISDHKSVIIMKLIRYELSRENKEGLVRCQQRSDGQMSRSGNG